jgi:hypothetical protein
VALLLALAVVNGLFLYLVPGAADTDYAWSIKPPVAAAFLGAGYLAGTVATGLVVFATRYWRSLRMLALPLVVLSVLLIAATIIHEDRFKWDYPLTWVWTVVYVGVPFGVAFLWRRQERAEPPVPPADRALLPLRLASGVIGAVVLVVALTLFFAPEGSLAADWPWALTPLLARATGAWYAMIGTSLLVCAVTLRRPHEAVIPYGTLAAWSAFVLALAPLHPDDVGGGITTAWAVGMAVLLALAVYALAVAGPRMRALGERL